MKGKNRGDIKRFLAGLLAAAVLVGGSTGVQPVSAGQSGNDGVQKVSVDELPGLAVREAKTQHKITGFVRLDKTEASISVREKVPLETLLASMPSSLQVYLDGEPEPVSIPVSWECVGDYSGSNYFYYQFNPQWDQLQYALSAQVKELPYIGVFLGRDSTMRFGTPTKTQNKIYNFMRNEMGFNMAAACGVLANIQNESSFNPTASVIDTNGLISFGLCQWNGPRYEALQDYCNERGYDFRTVDGQLKYLKYELETSERRACSMVKNVENTAAGAYLAGYNWARYFERCASVYFEARGNLARDTYWPMYSGEDPGPGDDVDDAPVGDDYSITYVMNGGENHEDNPDSYASSDKTIVLKNPIRTGYRFEGWYKNKSMTVKVTSIPGGSKGNIRLYAKWVPICYTIRFDGNKATSGNMAEMKNCEYDGIYTLGANKFKRTGYKFTGWNTKADGSGADYSNKENVENLTAKDGKVITFYAQWARQTYTIDYRLMGGTMQDDNREEYTVNTKTFSLKAPVRTGYTFLGWYREKSYRNRVTQIPKGSTGNLTLYAKWQVNQYKIVYKANKADSGSMPAETVCRYGKKYTLPANKFKRNGYVFAGWNTKADGSGKEYGNKAKVKNLSSKNNKTVTLYAQWKRKSYSIQYELNGGVMSNGNRSTYYENTKTFTLKAPEREGYTFKGWYTDKKFQNKITKIKKGSKKNYKLYAKWEANHYTIVFDGNGAQQGTMKKLGGCRYDKEYTLPGNVFAREGYLFVGWNTAPDGGDIYYGDRANVKNLTAENGESVILYAQWEKN